MQESSSEFQADLEEQNATPKARAARRQSQPVEVDQHRAPTPKPDTPPSNDDSASNAGSPVAEEDSQDYPSQELEAMDSSETAKQVKTPVKPIFENKPQYFEITPLDLANITAARMINLYLAISGPRKAGYFTRENIQVCNLSELEHARNHGNYLRLPYQLTHQILSKQYRAGMKALLARVKFENDPKAAAILQEIIEAIQNRYALKLKLIEAYPAEKLRQINLNALHNEIIALISEIESDPLTMYFEEVECVINFKQKNLAQLINRIRHLANEVPALAEKLHEFFASIRVRQVEKILAWEKKYFQDYTNFWTISVACHQLPKLLCFEDSTVNLAMAHYVQNAATCKFSPLLRACFALIAINANSEKLSSVTAVNVKDLFEVHANKPFNSDNVENLLNALKDTLTKALNKEVPSSSYRIFSPSKKPNPVAVEQIHTMLKWISTTDLSLEHDELDDNFDNFVLLSPQTTDTKTEKSTLSRMSAVKKLNNSDTSQGMIPVTPAKSPEALDQAESEDLLSISSDDDSKGKGEGYGR